MQNNSSFKLFKREEILIHSLSLLHFRFQSNAVRSINIPWFAQSTGPQWPVCWLGYVGMKGGVSERVNNFPLPQNIQASSGTHTASYSVSSLVISRINLAGGVNNSVPTLPVLRIRPVTAWWRHKSSDVTITVVSILKFIDRRKVQNAAVQLSVWVTGSWEQLLCVKGVQLG